MTSLQNGNSNSRSMNGLSSIYANDINCDTITTDDAIVEDELIVKGNTTAKDITCDNVTVDDYIIVRDLNPIFYSTSGTGTVSALTPISGSSDTYLAFTAGTVNLSLIVNVTCDIFMIGGGGGGGRTHAGGGGAGAYYWGTNLTLGAATYTITVGDGGLGQTNFADNGTNGGNTTIALAGSNVYIVNGGGRGGGSDNTASANTTSRAGKNGGCGGGGGSFNGNPTPLDLSIPAGSASNTSTNGSGNNGGTGCANQSGGALSGGGGGGIGGVGGNAPNSQTGSGGAGGAGLTVNITGTDVVYGGGGGGGVWGNAYSIVGGSGGGVGATIVGGRGGTNTSILATNGVANTGSGGGGGGPFDAAGANGGSGIVIIRFKAVVVGDKISNIFKAGDALVIEGNEPNSELQIRNRDALNNLITTAKFTGGQLYIGNRIANAPTTGSVIVASTDSVMSFNTFGSLAAGTDYVNYDPTTNVVRTSVSIRGGSGTNERFRFLINANPTNPVLYEPMNLKRDISFLRSQTSIEIGAPVVSLTATGATGLVDIGTDTATTTKMTCYPRTPTNANANVANGIVICENALSGRGGIFNQIDTSLNFISFALNFDAYGNRINTKAGGRITIDTRDNGGGIGASIVSININKGDGTNTQYKALDIYSNETISMRFLTYFDRSVSLRNGYITVNLTSPDLGAGQFYYEMANNLKTRWVAGLQTAETGSNAGSDYCLFSYNDAGAYLGNPLRISRTGNLTINGGVINMNTSTNNSAINVKGFFAMYDLISPNTKSTTIYKAGNALVFQGADADAEAQFLTRDAFGNLTTSAVFNAGYNLLIANQHQFRSHSGIASAPILRIANEPTDNINYIQSGPLNATGGEITPLRFTPMYNASVILGYNGSGDVTINTATAASGCKLTVNGKVQTGDLNVTGILSIPSYSNVKTTLDNISGGTTGITYNSATDTTTIDNNVKIGNNKKLTLQDDSEVLTGPTGYVMDECERHTWLWSINNTTNKRIIRFTTFDSNMTDQNCGIANFRYFFQLAKVIKGVTYNGAFFLAPSSGSFGQVQMALYEAGYGAVGKPLAQLAVTGSDLPVVNQIKYLAFQTAYTPTSTQYVYIGIALVQTVTGGINIRGRLNDWNTRYNITTCATGSLTSLVAYFDGASGTNWHSYASGLNPSQAMTAHDRQFFLGLYSNDPT